MNRLAIRRGIKLRRSYSHVAKAAAMMAGSDPLLHYGTSRLTVDADPPKWRAIDRNE